MTTPVLDQVVRNLAAAKRAKDDAEERLDLILGKLHDAAVEWEQRGGRDLLNPMLPTRCCITAEFVRPGAPEKHEGVEVTPEGYGESGMFVNFDSFCSWHGPQSAKAVGIHVPVEFLEEALSRG